MSPTQRTLAECKRQGWLAAVVEKWIPVPSHPAKGVRKDAFGFIDIIVLTGGIVAIQATSGANTSARVKKIAGECREAAIAWLECGGRIQVVGWRKLKPRGQKVARWHAKVVEVTLADLTLEGND